MTDTATIRKLERMALTLRADLIEMIGVGKVGHLGGSSSLAEIAACLYFHAMRYDPRNPKDPDRDRFVLSKGHCVLIQYAALAELGVIPRSELKRVKTLEGCLQGHPDMDHTPGIEAVTGSLGMGLSIGLGMALGFRLDRRPSHVYVIMGDGELSEGQIWEAAMAAAAFKIDNLTGFVDLNRIQATGPTQRDPRHPGDRAQVGGLRVGGRAGRRARRGPDPRGARYRPGDARPADRDRGRDRQGQGVLVRREQPRLPQRCVDRRAVPAGARRARGAARSSWGEEKQGPGFEGSGVQDADRQ